MDQAVHAVLADADEPLRLRDVRERAAKLLDGSVAYSRIDLESDSRHPAPYVLCDTQGRYVLRDT